MKTRFTFLLLMVAAFFSTNAQQVPNPSFDQWASPLAPDNWSSYDAIFGVGIGHCLRDSVDKLYGVASAKVVSDSVPGFGSYGVLAGTVAVGNGMANPNPVFPGIAFAYKPDSIFLVYKYTSPGTDTARMLLKMTNGGSGIFTGGAAYLSLPLDTSSQWALLYTVVSSFYVGATLPDTLGLQFYSSMNIAPNGGVQGSTLNVDGVLFGYVNPPVAIQELADKLNISVYPNPTSDVINISSEESIAGFRVMITDMAGKIAGGAILEGEKNSINVSGYANGTYTYRIADKAGNILKGGRFNVMK